MAASSPHSMRDQTADIDDWSIIGDPSFVRDKIEEYRDRLGVTHMIVRGRVPGVTDQTWLSSLEKLVAAQ